MGIFATLGFLAFMCSLALLVGAWLVGPSLLIGLRRERVRRQPFPPSWREILRRRMPAFASLPADVQLQIKKHAQVLIAEKPFIGCAGLDVTEEMRVLVSVDRLSQYVICRLMPQVTAEATAKWIDKDIIKSGFPFSTITTDRGGEFANLGVTFENYAYVCEPNCPNQRGTNENIIGLVRQYAPKGKSLSHLTQRDVKKIQDKLNHRPRKTLGYHTPHEIMFNCQLTVRC